VYVRIAVGEPGLTTLAMLDTGSTYSVLDADLVELMGAFDEADAPVVELATRHGVLRGRLVRRRVWLLAEKGESLEVDATFCVAREWRYGHFGFPPADSLRDGPTIESDLLRSHRVGCWLGDVERNKPHARRVSEQSPR
jgi:hypothetical protein